MAIDIVAAGGVRRERRRWFRYDRAGHLVAVADLLVIMAASLLCGAAYDVARGDPLRFPIDSPFCSCC